MCLTLCCWNSWHSYRTVRELGGEGGGWEKMMLNKGIKSLFFTSMLEMFLYWKKDPPPFSVSLKIENSSFFEGTGDHECIRNNVSVLRVGFRSISEACKPTNITYSEIHYIFKMERLLVWFYDSSIIFLKNTSYLKVFCNS